MKRISLLLYTLQVVVIASLNLFSVKAADGDFGAWVLNKDGHGGMNAGKLTYTGKDMTVEFWLYIDEAIDKNLNGTNIISNRHNGNNGFSVSLATNTATGNADIRVVFKNSIPDGTASDQVFTMFLPRAKFSNKWGHLAFVISSTEKKAYLFLNGGLNNVIEDFYTDWIGNRTTDDLCIGYWYTNAKFYGRMADIRIWNTARTIDEIAENYNKPLTGTKTGLQVYYNFGNFAQTIANAVNAVNNTGSLLPTATWSDFHNFEVLAQKPTSLAIANDEVTWTAEGVSWDVEVRSNSDNSLLRSGTVNSKSFSLAGLSPGYIVKIRTFNNGVYSDWAIYNYLTAVSSPELSQVTVSSFNDRIKVTNGASATLSIYDIEGRFVAEFKLSQDIEYIDASFLRKGLYICQIRKENFSVTSKLIK